MRVPVQAVGANDGDPPVSRRAGPFAQSLILGQAFSFLGGLVYLTSMVKPDPPGFHEPGPPTWADESARVGHGWLGAVVEQWDAATTGWVSVGFIVLLCFLASRVTRSRTWAVVAGVSSLALAALWIVLAVDVGGGAFSDSGFAAAVIIVGTSPLVAAAGACLHVGLRRRPRAGPTGGAPIFPLGLARVLGRGYDVVLLSLPLGAQTILTDVVGGIGLAGSPTERWVSSLRWAGVFLTEAVCIGWLGQTPGKVLAGVRVEGVAGGRLPAPRAFLRTAFVFGGFFVLWIPHAVTTLIRRDSVGLHDLVSGARVRRASLSP